MHNAALETLRLNWRYLAFDVAPENLREAIAGAQRMKFVGLNLTVPHKLLALKMVDVLDVSAKKWGAVNTIRFETRTNSGRWVSLARVPAEKIGATRSVGFNSDAEALSRSLREDLHVKIPGAKILLLGAGGAGRGAAFKLAADGAAELFLINRTQKRTRTLSLEIRKSFPRVHVSTSYPAARIDLLVNATSLGLKPSDPMPFDRREFSLDQADAVYDLIYRPAVTELLRAAKRAGCRTANGLGMLLYQGAKALEIWSGQRAPIEVMRRALAKNIYG